MTLLHDLAQKYGIRVKEGNKLPFRLSHQEIANLIGSTRETVTLELNTLKKNGDIIVQGKDLILPIKNPSSLS
jgi:CRP-like cAMP-binding protein